MIMKLLGWWRTLTSLRSITIGSTTIGRLRNLDVNDTFDSMSLIPMIRMFKFTLSCSGSVYSYGIFIRYSEKEVESLINSVTMEDIDLDPLEGGDYERSANRLPKLGVGRSSDQLRLDLQKQLMFPTKESN
jgi:hypothetical protein